LPVKGDEEPEIEDFAWQTAASTIIVPASDVDPPHDSETVPDFGALDTPGPLTYQKPVIRGSEDFIVPDSEGSDADSPVLGRKLDLAQFAFVG